MRNSLIYHGGGPGGRGFSAGNGTGTKAVEQVTNLSVRRVFTEQQLSPSFSDITIDWDDVVYDVYSNFTAVNNEVKAPEDGMYTFNLTMHMRTNSAGAGGQIEIYHFINGTKIWVDTLSQPNGFDDFNVSSILKLPLKKDDIHLVKMAQYTSSTQVFISTDLWTNMRVEGYKYDGITIPTPTNG